MQDVFAFFTSLIISLFLILVFGVLNDAQYLWNLCCV